MKLTTNIEYLDADEYLRKTDWYVIRKAENGKAIPEEVLEKREKCREIISDLKA